MHCCLCFYRLFSTKSGEESEQPGSGSSRYLAQGPTEKTNYRQKTHLHRRSSFPGLARFFLQHFLLLTNMPFEMSSKFLKMYFWAQGWETRHVLRPWHFFFNTVTQNSKFWWSMTSGLPVSPDSAKESNPLRARHMLGENKCFLRGKSSCFLTAWPWKLWPLPQRNGNVLNFHTLIKLRWGYGVSTV